MNLRQMYLLTFRLKVTLLILLGVFVGVVKLQVNKFSLLITMVYIVSICASMLLAEVINFVTILYAHYPNTSEITSDSSAEGILYIIYNVPYSTLLPLMLIGDARIESILLFIISSFAITEFVRVGIEDKYINSEFAVKSQVVPLLPITDNQVNNKPPS